MKEKIKELVVQAVKEAHARGDLPSDKTGALAVEEPKLSAHGDFSTNAAMVMASLQKMAPRKIAQTILSHLDDRQGLLAASEIAGPGFINFFVQPAAWHPLLGEIIRADDRYGSGNLGRGRKIQVEFVSSNPTGPLHVGHGRGAAVGDSVARILAFAGYSVQKEYYINDSGRQIHTLGRSVFLRYQELLGGRIEFPAECYQGGYIRDLAQEVRKAHGASLLQEPEEQAVMACARFAAKRIMGGIREDLEAFGVTYDCWFSEQSLYDDGKVDSIITELTSRKMIYRKDGALWFRSTEFGDEKDRVVVRANGRTTYFASDIAYHQDKYRRGLKRVIDVWGADHHGYIPRVTAAIEACGQKRDQFQVILVQLVNLLRGGLPAAMSTRAGEFVTLADVVDEVGKDAARFIFLTRNSDSNLDFDLELAKQKTNDNPVYYVQYVHARIASILRKGVQRGIGGITSHPEALSVLTAVEEIQLIKTLARFPETIRRSAELMEPHRITFYLMDLAAAFHGYYNKHRVLSDDAGLTAARLCLITAVQKVIRNGLTLLGVSAPQKM